MFGTSFVLYGVVRTTGAVMAPLIMLIISLWVVRVPFAFSMLDRWHADAIWWSFPIASIISVTLSSSYYRFGGWRKVRLGVAEIRTAPGGALSSTALSSTALSSTARSSGALGSGAGSAAGGSAAALAGRAAANTTPSS